jgi:hypothetical protein
VFSLTPPPLPPLRALDFVLRAPLAQQVGYKHLIGDVKGR